MEESGINTIVVKALMSLRGMSAETMAGVLQVRLADLLRWLERDEEAAIPVHRQMEVLDMLGVRGESLRPDLVHYWKVSEPIFGSEQKVYSALHVLTESFGKAQVVYLAQEADPTFSLTAKAHFGLKFPGFYAILEVKASPFMNVKFGPEVSSGLAWMEGSVGLLLESDKYRALEPGAVQPEDLADQVDTVQNLLKWEQLSELAKTVKVTPDQLAAIVQKVANNQLTFNPTAADIEAERATPEPLVAEEEAVAASTPSTTEAVTPAPAAAAAPRTGSFSFVR